MHAIDMWETYELNEFRWKILKAHRLPVFPSFPFNFVFIFCSFDCYLNFWFWNPNFFFLVFSAFFLYVWKMFDISNVFQWMCQREEKRSFFLFITLSYYFLQMNGWWMNESFWWWWWWWRRLLSESTVNGKMIEIHCTNTASLTTFINS